MDWTLIKTKSGKNFATNANDWTWWDDKVLPKLKKLVTDGYRIVVFTNQGGVSVGKTSIQSVK